VSGYGSLDGYGGARAGYGRDNSYGRFGAQQKKQEQPYG
jgi:hypothetical protein